ncbi:MAG: hypothetical protein HOP31_01650 [Ignavibacteria bacterium]|nr:hypothetical protein [Ignavibacteria bacterium]
MNSEDKKIPENKIVNTTQRHLIILIVTVIILGAVGEYFYHRFEYSRIMSLVDSEKTEHDSLLQKIISFKSSSLAAYTNDYTYWDEMVLFAQSGDTAWGHGNIDASLSTYGADYVWVFDSTEALKYFTASPGTPELDKTILNVKTMMEFSADKRSNHFFIEANGKIIELSVYSIHPTADPQRLGEPRGYYAAGRLWNPEYLHGISELTGTGLKFRDGVTAVIPSDGDNDFLVTNLFDLTDSSGKVLTQIISFKEFSNLKAAYSQFRFQLIVMNFIVALVLIFSTFVLYHIVNKPLRNINKSLLTGESIHILPLINKRNEFGHLAKMINDFFEQKQILLNEIQERIDAELKIKISEEKLKGSLQEKEVLIKEVHHRVKNNLQIIISLIRLQASKVSDENLNSHLNETLNRIKSIALVHEMLYRSDDLSHIEFKEYIHKITESLRTIYADKTGRVSINVQSDDVYLTVEKAVPCAIIINELVTNSIKHAFKKSDSGDINISMNRQNGFYSMKIADNGSGLASGFKLHKNGSLGMNLVDSLADQLDADVSIDSFKGTSFDFRFPVN